MNSKKIQKNKKQSSKSKQQDNFVKRIKLKIINRNIVWLEKGHESETCFTTVTDDF